MSSRLWSCKFPGFGQSLMVEMSPSKNRFWEHSDGFRVEAPWQGFPPSGSRLDEETPTKPPPIAVPDIPGVRFLSNVGDIQAEGEQMHHCITLYAERAVAGHSYLFHVDYEGNCASVEVDLRGQVRQSCGPRNKPTRASEHGARILRRWGGEFKTAAASW